MTLRTQLTPDGIYRADDPDDPSIEAGYGATRKEAKADAGQASERQLTPVLSSGLPVVFGTEPSPETESENEAAVRRFKYEKTTDGWVYYESDNPDVKYPETPAEKQADDWGKKYLRVVNKVLEKHDLLRRTKEGEKEKIDSDVPEYVRVMLAGIISTMRELEAVKTVEVMEKVKALNIVDTVDGKPQAEIIEVERPVRVEAPKQKEARSPIPALRKAKTHLDKLLDYAEKPPARASSITTRCASLRKALLSSSIAAWELALESTAEAEAVNPSKTNSRRLYDALEKGYALETKRLSPSQRRKFEAQRDRLLEEYSALMDKWEPSKAIDVERWWNECDRITEEYGKTCETLEVDWGGVEELRKLQERIDNILARGEDWRHGQPPALTRRIVKLGCIAWRVAGREPKYSYHRVGGRWVTDGPLPDFLRDLIACCNGTHEWVKKPPRRVPKYYRLQEFPKRGDGIQPTDTAIHQAIMKFWPRQKMTTK